MIDLKKFSLLIFTLELFFLLYLCSLDVYFVVFQHSVEGWYNDVIPLVIISPFLSALVAFKYGSIKNRMFFCFSVFFISAVVLYFKILWVATEFHVMIGGQI